MLKSPISAFRMVAPLFGATLAACSDTTGGEPAHEITLSVIASQPEPPSATSGSVEIGAVRLVLGGIKLETAGVDETVDWVFDQSKVVELDLSGDPVTAHALFDIPPGTYKEIEISIDKLEPGKPSEATLLAENPDLADASIVITGTVLDGGTEVPFTFTAALDRDMEILLTPLLVFPDDGAPAGFRLTLLLDLAGWFRNQAGQWLDPRNPADRSAIEASIQSSLEAFEDGNLDGVPGS